MEFTELELEKPITTQKLNQFHTYGIYTVEDLLRTYPKKYIDYRHPSSINEAEEGDRVAFAVTIENVTKRMGKTKEFVTASCRDSGTGTIIRVIWFNPYIYKSLWDKYGKRAVVCGVLKIDEYGYEIVEPDVFTITESEDDVKKALRIYPVYKKIPGMSNDYFQNVMNASLEQCEPKETLPEDAKKHFGVISEQELIRRLHYPANIDEIKSVSYRLIFEKMYRFANKMLADAKTIEKKSNIRPYRLTNTNRMIQKFPYELTEDQQNVVSTFVREAQSGKRINALIQGDVGCGKTVCVFLLMASMSDNGYQSVLMAPTGVLARQHYEELRSYAEPLGLTTVYLDGNMKASEKKKALVQIESGEADFVIGTHSVISDSVKFHALGLTVVDEEHKFGVIQRENLKRKAQEGVHSVSMSATPIPRSLALTLYDDALDIYTIKSMPCGRKPVKTATVNEDRVAFRFMESEIKNGHQCYVVCPLISEEDSDSDREPESVETVLTKLRYFFALNESIRVEAITGKMKDAEKSEIIERFKRNETQILVATTIIEVGVNVPNATVITIMDADRFGLASLHQLRGRVGRSSLQSYCLLKSDCRENPRLEAMCRTTDGFVIAEEDLKLRGTGDFLGTRQSGENEDIRMMLKYPKLYENIKIYIKSKKKGE